MSFENKTTAELLRIAKAGLGFSMISSNKTVDDINKINLAAIESGAKITFIDSISIQSNLLKSLRPESYSGIK